MAERATSEARDRQPAEDDLPRREPLERAVVAIAEARTGADGDLEARAQELLDPNGDETALRELLDRCSRLVDEVTSYTTWSAAETLQVIGCKLSADRDAPQVLTQAALETAERKLRSIRDTAVTLRTQGDLEPCAVGALVAEAPGAVSSARAGKPNEAVRNVEEFKDRLLGAAGARTAPTMFESYFQTGRAMFPRATFDSLLRMSRQATLEDGGIERSQLAKRSGS